MNIYLFIFIIFNSALLKVKQIDTKLHGPIVILPTHKSYIDFLVLQYVFFANRMSHPYIAAADDFLGIAGVNRLLRASGAFFLKRKQTNNLLYNTIFKEYV